MWHRQGLAAAVSLIATAAAHAAESPVVTIPKLTKPLVEAVEGDPLQTNYDKMWEECEAALSKIRQGVVLALDNQIAKATEDGDLDQVEHWEAVKKRFEAEGTLAWDTSAKAAAEWKKSNPKAPFPREFNDAVRSAVSGADSTVEKLEEGYASLVKAYTKAKNVARAKDLRAEVADFGQAKQKPQAPPNPPPAATPKRVAAGKANNVVQNILQDFAFPDQPWQSDKNGEVFGKTGAVDLYRRIWMKKSVRARRFEYSVEMKVPSYQLIALSINNSQWEFSRGHWWNRQTLIRVPGQGEKHLPGRVETPNEWHRLSASCDGRTLVFRYDGNMVAEYPVDGSEPFLLNVGFDSHENTVRVRNVVLLIDP